MYSYTYVSARPPYSYPCGGGYYTYPYPSQHPYAPHQYGSNVQLDPQLINYQSCLSQHPYMPHQYGSQVQLDSQLINYQSYLSQHPYAPHQYGSNVQLDPQLINYQSYLSQHPYMPHQYGSQVQLDSQLINYQSYLSQHPYAPYQYGSQRQLDPHVSTSSTNLEPTMEYAGGRTYVHFSYPVPMTIILDENGEVVDDYSQFYDEEKLKKELIHREETISKCLKTRTLIQSEDHPKPEEPDICVICQAEYEDNERIGTLECGHEYHADCIKKWLLQNTLCPICKTTALATKN